MNRKMFFIDLDGTTLKDDKTVPEENIQAIQEAVDEGHYVAISTGRAIVSARAICEKLQMLRKGCFLVSYNGALIYDLSDESLLRELKLPDAYAQYLFQEAKKYGLHIQAYSDTAILAEKECPELAFYASKTSMGYQIVPDIQQWTSFDTPKVLLVNEKDPSVLKQFQKDHKAWEEGKCTSFFSCPEYLEYCPLHGTKADGIRFFEEYLNLRHEDTIAIGDEENDLSMIKEAGVGVVMCNARTFMKQYADYITERDNNHGGVAEVIRKFTNDNP